MDNKAIIIPKGKYFLKNGLKIDDSVLLKYNATMLGKKWNIWPCKEINKKQEKYWTKTKTKYKKMDDDTYELTHTWKQKYTIKELKTLRIEEIQDSSLSAYITAKQTNEARIGLGLLKEYDLSSIKVTYEAAVSAINAFKTYQEVIDYRDYGV